MLRLIGFIAGCFLFVSTALAVPPKNVLILHEGSRLLPYQLLMSNELQKDLTSKRFDIQIYEEYLDAGRLGGSSSKPVEALEAKYGGRRFDAVVADGTSALRLLLNQLPTFMRGTPVVFLSVADYEVPSTLPANFTGVMTHVDYAGTIRLASSLQPGLQHVYYIDGDRNLAKSAALRAEFAPFHNRLDVVTWQDVPLDELLKRVESLPSQSAVLFDDYLRDPNDGKTYIPADVGALLAAHADAPVYSVYQTMIGRGLVGGAVVNFEIIGRQGAKMILALLAGAPVSQYPVERSATDVEIDWRKFQQFGFSEGNLPSSAIILFRSPTLWEKYHWYLIAGGVVILLQAALIIELALAGKLRKRSEQAARELASRLINAQEEEWRRIAGELHDDVSQRLALVAIHLDMMRETPPASRAELMHELSALFDETDRISSDIHRFSHKLHPAVLERLGLVPALRRYCSEFSAHRKIEVEFSSSGKEPAVPLETALAFFRIGQECLMNAAKHGGATKCEVALTYAGRRIMLAVKDNGAGFDPKGVKAKMGVGIQSMRERLRSIGGRLRIESSFIRGTTVFADVEVSYPGVPHGTEMTPQSSDTESTASAI